MIYPGKETAAILRGMAISVSCKAFAVLFTYALHFALARTLGGEGFGIFSLAFAILVSLAFLARFGLDYVMLRRSALHAASGEMGSLRPWFARSEMLAGTAAALLALLVLATGRELSADIFSKNSLHIPLLIMAVGIPPQALLFLQAETLKGAGKIRASQMLQGDGGGLVVFGAALLLAFPLSMRYGVNGAAAGFVMASWLSWLAGERMTRSLFAGKSGALPPTFAELFRLGLPLLAASALSIIIARAATVFLGIWASATAVGIFAMSQKLALLGSNIQTACLTVIGPKIAVLHKKGDMSALAGYYGRGTRLIAGLTLVILGGIAMLATDILALFGPDFIEGANALRILAGGEMLSLLLGPTSIALITTGHSQEHCVCVGMAAAVMLMAGTVLIPGHGLTGAAFAAAGATLTQNVFQALFIRKRLGFFPSAFCRG